MQRWDPQRPDKNPGPRPLAQMGRPGAPPAPVPSAAPEQPAYSLHVGSSVVAKGVGLIVRGNAPRGTVLLASALRAGRPTVTDTVKLLDFRA